MFIYPFDTKILKLNFSNMPSSNINDLLAANPYRNQQYNESGWQRFLSALGFRTQKDAWEENMSVQAAEYDAALLQKQHDTEYDNAQSQVARMRAAGLNPDIDPSSVSAGDAAPMGEDPSTPMQSTGDEVQIFGVVEKAANMIMSGFTSGLGLISSIQGIKSNHISNVLGSINTESAFNQFVQDKWKDFLPLWPDDEVMVNEYDWKADAQKRAEVFSGSLPKRFRKKFSDVVSQYWDNAPATREAYQAWSAEAMARKSYYQESQENHSQIDSVLKDISEPLSKMAEKIYSQAQKTELAQLKEGQSQAQNEAEYFDTLDASQQARTENAENILGETNATIVSTLNSTLEEITSNLRKKSDEGGIAGSLASMALVAIAGVRLWLGSVGLPSVSRSTSVTHSDVMTRNGRTRTDKQSSSSSLSW